MRKFYCLYQYPGQLGIHVLMSSEDEVIVADNEEDKQLIINAAEKLVADNIISGYRIVQEV